MQVFIRGCTSSSFSGTVATVRPGILHEDAQTDRFPDTPDCVIGRSISRIQALLAAGTCSRTAADLGQCAHTSIPTLPTPASPSLLPFIPSLPTVPLFPSFLPPVRSVVSTLVLFPTPTLFCPSIPSPSPRSTLPSALIPFLPALLPSASFRALPSSSSSLSVPDVLFPSRGAMVLSSVADSSSRS